MSSSYRMRWRPALGVLVLGSIAIGLGIKGAAAEKARVATRDKKDGPQAGVVSTPRPVSSVTASPVAKGTETQQSKAVKKDASLPEGAVAVPAAVVGGVERPTNWVEPDELPNFTGVEALIGQAPTFANSASIGSVAAGTTGACCLASSCTCVPNQTAAQCAANVPPGFYNGDKSTCANDICGCNLRACCSPAGACTGDVTRAVCEAGGGSWNADADCNTGSTALPSPTCNAFVNNNCSWDNGAPLNDGGASRAHTFSGAPGGQLPRYDFSTSDDFVLRGPDTVACEVGTAQWYFRARPSDTTGPIFTPPDPANDLVGVNVTVYKNFLHPQTGFDQPGGRGTVPQNEFDFNPKTSDTPGGVVYARTFLNNQGAILYTLQPGFCDPPPAVGTETAAVYEAAITIVPPILLNKGIKYWLDVQGLFPFNDGLRETLQTWWMPSSTNTLIRGRTYRTANGNYTPLAAPADVCVANVDCAAYVGGFCDSAVISACSVLADCPAGSVCINGDGVAGAPNPGQCSVAPPGIACSVAADCPLGSNCAGGDNVAGPPNPGICVIPVPLCRFQAWEPTETTLIGAPTLPTQRGNQGAVAPCAALPQRTRLDFAFKLNGGKDPVGPPANNACSAVFSAPQNAFDGSNPFDNTGATTAAVGACAVNQDLWFRYIVTCNGVVTIGTCDSSFNSALAVYDNFGCPVDDTDLLGCDSASCVGSDDGTVQVIRNFSSDLLIRVGGDGAAVGKGILKIECDAICGQPDGDTLVNNCCIDHSSVDPMAPALSNLGCENPICCDVVCTTPGEETCCDNNNDSGGWDSECAGIAAASEVCGCPCLTFACANTESLEPLCTSPEGNPGCSVAAPPAGAFEPATALTIGVGASKCGRLHTTTTSRDVDWWPFSVPGSGFATLTISLNSTTQAALLVFGRETLPDIGAGEDYCYDKVCSGASSCGGQVACTEDADCETLENPTGTCDTVGTTLLLFDAIATSGCQATDGLGAHCDALVTCVPAPGLYQVVALTAQAADDNCTLGDGIFSGVNCGASDTYGFTVTATTGCTNGACCTFAGGCEDGSPGLARNEYECFLAGGTFAGEGETCEALPIDIDCMDLAHGCAAAQTITCGQTIAVNLTTDDHFPEEGYPCGAAGNDPNDRAWLKFTAPCVDDGAGGDCNDEAGPDVTSVRLDTCTSANPGRDSLLAIFGSCCPLSGLCPSGAACTPGVHLCGGSCDAATPFDIAGCSDDVCGFTDFLSDICAQDLIEGEMYFIQVSNWAEPVNGIYQLRLTCPCTGSCCDPATEICTDGAPADTCDSPKRFSTQFACSGLIPACGMGACCAPNGTCTNVLGSLCPATSNHNPGAACSSIVCNVENSCDYETGDPTSGLSQAPFGFRTQYAQDIDLFLEIADQFEMKGSTGNGCEISSILYTTFHTSHDTPNFCLSGGGAGCSDKASEYDGIIVTISEDVAGDEKGPTCEPVCTATECTAGPDGDYHADESTPGCQSYRFGAALGENDPIPTNNYWTYTEFCEGQCEFYITLNFQPPILVEKNKKNWLSVVHIVPEMSRYSVIQFASVNFNGNFSQAYNSLGTQDFEPLDGTPNDQLFRITGIKETPGCGTCNLFGDVAPLPAVKCLVDVDDLLCALDSFSLIGVCGAGLLGDIVTSGGGCTPDTVDDVDDILAVLDAFSGIYQCSHVCPPGACVGDFTDNPPGINCRDGDNAGAFFVGNGMSQSDCSVLTGGTGTYCGDGSVCLTTSTCTSP